MFKFNSSNIFAGYIKQLLATFNLPTVNVVTDKRFMLAENQLYIYNNQLIQITQSTLTENLEKGTNYEVICDYKFNNRMTPSPFVQERNIIKPTYYMPFTKTLQNSNQVYDSYTHKYLGNYLHFIKDYKNLDLMSLYNCFSNEIVNNIEASKSKTITIGGTSTAINMVFSSKDSNYKIYMVPVRFFEKYTIAIQSDYPIEVCCGFYNNNIITDKDILPHTYAYYGSMSFNHPVVYDNLVSRFEVYRSGEDLDTENQNMFREKDLKIFIKIPVQNSSSIVVLEGAYSNNNDFIIDSDKSMVKYNKSVVNIDCLKEDPVSVFPDLNSPLQLLKINTGNSYPFADRLMEYLTHNAVDSTDTTADNVRRVQKYITDSDMGVSINYPGIWEDKYKYLLYGLTLNKPKTYFDILGYCDKDVEQIMGDINIYPDSINRNT